MTAALVIGTLIFLVCVVIKGFDNRLRGYPEPIDNSGRKIYSKYHSNCTADCAAFREMSHQKEHKNTETGYGNDNLGFVLHITNITQFGVQGNG